MSPSANSNPRPEPPRILCYDAALLRRLRNEIPIDALIRKLDWPHKRRDGRFVFLCPGCREFLTAVKRETNLGRCFACERNFNPIDFTIQACGNDFVQAVEFLRPLLAR
jgi:DNA primase